MIPWASFPVPQNHTQGMCWHRHQTRFFTNFGLLPKPQSEVSLDLPGADGHQTDCQRTLNTPMNHVRNILYGLRVYLPSVV